MRPFHTAWTTWKSMPLGIRFLTVFSMAFTLFIPAAIIPFGQHYNNGVEESYGEFWRDGGGPMFIGVGLVAVAFVYGFARARRWVRPATIVLCWLLVAQAVFDEHQLSGEVATTILIGGLLPIWYLYYRRPVRVYFSTSDEKPVA